MTKDRRLTPSAMQKRLVDALNVLIHEDPRAISEHLFHRTPINSALSRQCEGFVVEFSHSEHLRTIGLLNQLLVSAGVPRIAVILNDAGELIGVQPYRPTR